MVLVRLHLFCLVICAVLSQPSMAQKRDAAGKKLDDLQAAPLPSFSKVLQEATFGTTDWSLSIEFKSEDHPAVTHEQFTSALDTFSVYEPRAEYQQAIKYRAQMKEAFRWFTLYCDNVAAFLPNLRNRPIPFRFADKDGKRCVILSDMASSSVYNTLRSTAKSRASQVLTSCLLPNLKYYCQAFEKTNISYLGMIIYYGSKDFSQESDVLSLKAEMLAFLAPVGKCRQFTQGEITESEFVASCDVYITDRDMKFSFKKVKLDIE